MRRRATPPTPVTRRSALAISSTSGPSSSSIAMQSWRWRSAVPSRSASWVARASRRVRHRISSASTCSTAATRVRSSPRTSASALAAVDPGGASSDPSTCGTFGGERRLRRRRGCRGRGRTARWRRGRRRARRGIRAASASSVATTASSSSWPRSPSSRRRALGDDSRQATGTFAPSGRRERDGHRDRTPPRAVSSASRATTSASRRASSAFSSDSSADDLDSRLGEGGELRAQGGDLPAGDVHPQAVELGRQLAVALRRLSLAFEWAQLATDLAQQVLEAQQARFRRVEAALRLLLALAELEHAGRFLDDRPPVLGASVEHGVDLSLADDHVLLTADASVGQQLLDVEEAAWHVVDGVLAVAAAEQRSLDGHLGELDRQDAGGVVDRQADLGTAECRSARRPGEDDVVHLLAAHGRRRLGAEHPGDGIDDVRLARAVRSDDDRDARLQLERRGVGERLEALEGQRSQEHGDPKLPVGRSARGDVPGVSQSGEVPCHGGFWAKNRASVWHGFSPDRGNQTHVRRRWQTGQK